MTEIVHMIDAGVNVECRNEHDLTPLLFATCHGNLGVMEILIEKNADVMAADLSGKSMLHFAAYDGEMDIMRYAVDNMCCKLSFGDFCGSCLSSPDHDGKTPLHIAIVEGNAHAAQFLIELGSCCESYDSNNNSLISSASFSGMHEILDILIEKTSFSSHKPNVFVLRANADGETALQLAAQCCDTLGSLICMTILLKNGCDINARCDHGGTALHDAVFMDNIDVVRLLLENSASVFVKDRRDITPLHIAAKNSNYKIAQMLIHATYYHMEPSPLTTASVNSLDFKSRSPLHYAVKAENFSLIHELMTNGASLSYYNLCDATTPFIVNFLLEFYEDTDDADKFDED